MNKVQRLRFYEEALEHFSNQKIFYTKNGFCYFRNNIATDKSEDFYNGDYSLFPELSLFIPELSFDPNAEWTTYVLSEIDWIRCTICLFCIEMLK